MPDTLEFPIYQKTQYTAEQKSIKANFQSSSVSTFHRRNTWPGISGSSKCRSMFELYD